MTKKYTIEAGAVRIDYLDGTNECIAWGQQVIDFPSYTPIAVYNGFILISYPNRPDRRFINASLVKEMTGPIFVPGKEISQ